MSSNRPEEGRLHRLARAKPNIPVTTWRKEHGRAGGNMQTIEREREERLNLEDPDPNIWRGERERSKYRYTHVNAS